VTVTLLRREMTPDEARAVAGWAYPPPFERYSHAPADTALFGSRDPADEGYSPAVDEAGTVIAFCVLGVEARIPGQQPVPGTVGLGVGVHPGLTDRGVGAALLPQALTLARSQPGARLVRVVVATDNTRSLALCHRAGFIWVRDRVGPGGRPFQELEVGPQTRHEAPR